MIVCLCNGVSESRVQTAIEQGASTRHQVTKSCHAGGDCGACHGSIRELLAEARVAEQRDLSRGAQTQERKDRDSGLLDVHLRGASA